MDKRIIKTKSSIRSVFLTLRDRTRLEKIRVTDICSLAEINKTTFYKYYNDIFDLNNEICSDVIGKIWEDFDARDCLLSDTSRFISELPATIDAQGEIIRILFHDRRDDLFSRLEEMIIQHYISDNTPRIMRLKLLFGIKGMIRMLYELRVQGYFTTDELAECACGFFAFGEAE